MLPTSKEKKLDDSICNPPSSDEIEVSIFGRGYGESIIIHLTQGHWIIVDSCINPSTKKPAALEYFELIGVDPSSAVKAIIATHWHDDHIRGLGEIFDACPSADFFCSDALDYKEFITLAKTYENNIMAQDTGIDEFKRIINTMDKRNKIPCFASANQLIFQNDILSEDGTITHCSIHSLSPSNHAKLAAIIDINRNQATEKLPKKRVIASTPNHAAVALWISINSYNILLGSDLEDTGNTNSGWTAIVKSNLKPSGKAKCFKIPHHGSTTAHNDDVWSNMVEAEHISLLSPFVRGNKILPSKSDVDRICNLSCNSYSAADFNVKKRVKRASAVEKMIKNVVKSIRITNPSFGHVRKRTSKDGTSRIELFYNAVPLNKLYN